MSISDHHHSDFEAHQLVLFRARHKRWRADKPNGYLRFADCGFSDRITGALIRGGIDTPELLLSTAPARIQLIQGIGPTLMKEIERYRAQFK